MRCPGKAATAGYLLNEASVAPGDLPLGWTKAALLGLLCVQTMVVVLRVLPLHAVLPVGFVMERTRSPYRRLGAEPPARRAESESERPTQNRQILLVHIGKAGGSSLSCNMRALRNISVLRCPESPDTAVSQSTVSDQVVEWGHMRHYTEGMVRRYAAYLVVVRQPISRLVSAFRYQQRYKDRLPELQKHTLASDLHHCYKSVNEAATLGLTGLPTDRRYTKDDDAEQKCKAVAREFLSGMASCGRDHFFYNYEYYAKPIFKYGSGELFVIRNEHMSEDFRRLDLFLGGTGVRPLEYRIRQQGSIRSGNITGLMSPAGLLALCGLLCREIYYYKTILLASANLNKEDVRDSFSEFGATCPLASAAPPALSQHRLRSPQILTGQLNTFGLCA